MCVVQDSSAPPLLPVFTPSFMKDATVSISFEQPTDPKLLSQVTQAVTWHFYAHCWFVLVTCYLCLSLLFKLVHNDHAWFLHERVPNALRKRLTHALHSLVQSLTHFVPIVAARKHCKFYTPGSGLFICLFCATFNQLYVYDTVVVWLILKYSVSWLSQLLVDQNGLLTDKV